MNGCVTEVSNHLWSARQLSDGCHRDLFDDGGHSKLGRFGDMSVCWRMELSTEGDPLPYSTGDVERRKQIRFHSFCFLVCFFLSSSLVFLCILVLVRHVFALVVFSFFVFCVVVFPFPISTALVLFLLFLFL